MATWRARLAERRAQAALTRAGFAGTGQDTAAEVLRQVQVLTRTRDLARLDYTTAEAAQAAIAALITPGPPAAPPASAAPGAFPDPASWSRPGPGINGTTPGQVTRAGQPGALPPAPAAAAEPATAGPAAGSGAPASQLADQDSQLMADAVRIVAEAAGTASGSARKRSASSSAAGDTASPTTPCGPCWPPPPTSPQMAMRQAASRPETRDAPAARPAGPS